ncbi:hypothetical protein LNAT_P0650 [Lebetimonas natsushimae]|uniref:Uncharacterized protein n=1 Tax=Lebetimonas natsushimae TaxID=1936991 RepID=A0A292YDK3_9BACT|nr:hypothetical protein [Lebetimonas natsushimae]GAX87355.1 hypothetical protein LNAT_P0650 [Lebetimonas natsushimae]
MKKIIFLFLIFFNFIFASDVILLEDDRMHYLQSVQGTDFHSVYSVYHTPIYKFEDSDTLYIAKDASDYNFYCVKKNSKHTYVYIYSESGSNHGGYSTGAYYLPTDYIGFCQNKDSYYYDSGANAWYSKDGDNPICPSNQYYDSNQSKCIDKPDCPSGMTFDESSGQCVCPDGTHFNSVQEKCMPDCPSKPQLEKEALQKCGSLSFAKNISCNIDTGEVNIQCMSCAEIMQAQYDLCAQNNLEVVENLSCSETDGALTLSPAFENISTSNCKPADNNTAGTDNNSDDTNNTGDSGNTGSNSGFGDTGGSSDSSGSSNTGGSSSSGGSGDTGGTSSSSGSSNTSGSSDNNSNCPTDLCYRYNHQQVGDNWSQSGNCWIWTNAPSGCPNKVCINDGQCSVSGSSNSNSGSNNIDLTPVTSRLDTVNSKLNNINNILNNIENMKPDDSFDPGNLKDMKTDYSDDMSSFLDKAKNSIKDLVNSFNKVKDLISSPKKITLFTSDSYSCPLVANIYNKVITIDICKFVSPYRPILLLFFTAFFSLSVFMFFLKTFINKGDD